MKNKPKPASRPKKQPKSPLIKTPAVKAALLGNKKKPAKKTGKDKIGPLNNAKLRKMERELRETKERLRLLTEATEEGIAIHDNGMIIDANDALARIFGYELSEIIGMKAERLATPETWKVIRKHIATKYNKPYEGVGVRKDGSTFICSLVGKPYKYKGRTVRLSTFHDITERKKAEEKLRREEERFRALAEQSSDIIVFVNRDGIVTYENPSMEKLLGFKPEERIGVNLFDRIHPDDLKFARDMFHKFAVNKSSKDVNSPVRQIRLHHQDGSWRTFETKAIKLIHNNIVETIMINLRDITERKKAEEALRESEEKYRLIFTYSPLGLLYFNGKGVIVACNNNFVQIIGSSQEKLIGLNMLNLPDKSLVFAVQKALSGSQGFYEGVYSSVTAKKNTPVRCLFAPTNIGVGNIPGGVGIIEDITERKQVEAQKEAALVVVRERDLQFRKLSFHVPGMIYQFMRKPDGTYCVPFTSEAIKNIFGCSPQDVREDFSPIAKVIFPEDLDKLITTFEYSAQHLTPWKHEYRVQIPGQSIKWIFGHSTPEKLADGSIIWHGFNTDNTERKNTEEALRESENKYRLLTEKISDIVWIQDMDLRTIYVTPSIQTVLGFTPEERMNQTVEEQLTPDSLSFVLEAMAKELALEKQMNTDPQKYVTFVLEFYHKDGSTRWLEAVLSGLRNDQGVLTGIHGVGRDITERKEAEEALKRTQLLNEAILESVPGILYLYDNAGHLVHWNKQHEILTGYSGDEIKGRYILDWFGGVEPDTSNIKKGISEVMEKGYASTEGHLITKNGNSIFMFFTGSKLSIAGKDHLLGVGVDITERKKAEEELKIYREHLEDLVRERTIKLEAANNELEAFSYSASHDLRAPLRSIDGFSQALLEDYEDKLDIQGKDYLIRIRAAINRMAELIEDLLQLSRITRTEMDMEKVNLTRIARLVIDELHKSQPQRIVDTRIAEGMEETADSKLMRIVLENLLGNAWKFTEKRAKALIEFGCTKKGERKVYFIRDNGVGFDMDYADKLFAPFQRLHTEEEFPGTGIGLATVRRIIHRHGGKIWTEGQTGKGATFHFSLNEK